MKAVCLILFVFAGCIHRHSTVESILMPTELTSVTSVDIYDAGNGDTILCEHRAEGTLHQITKVYVRMRVILRRAGGCISSTSTQPFISVDPDTGIVVADWTYRNYHRPGHIRVDGTTLWRAQGTYQSIMERQVEATFVPEPGLGLRTFICRVDYVRECPDDSLSHPDTAERILLEPTRPDFR